MCSPKAQRAATTNEAGGDFGVRLRSQRSLFPTEQTSDRLIAQSVNLPIRAAVAQTQNITAEHNHPWGRRQTGGGRVEVCGGCEVK